MIYRRIETVQRRVNDAAPYEKHDLHEENQVSENLLYGEATV